MPTVYIHKLPDWPRFHWDYNALAVQLANVRFQQGKLIGEMKSIGFSLQEEAVVQTLTQDVVKSSEIEGQILNQAQVRSSVAQRMGVDIGGLVPSDRNIDGVVEMLLDATRNFNVELSKERLFSWHSALFPTGYSGLHPITVGAWRKGPMKVISGPYGHEHTHFEAPEADRVEQEMTAFVDWFNNENSTDLVLKAGIAHLWFVTIHPFDDGNGRISRALADMLLARSENSYQRFYSMSTQIRQGRDAYYDHLEAAQKGSMDITETLGWFLDCMNRALAGARGSLSKILQRAKFWDSIAGQTLNERQRKIITMLLEDFKGNLTSSKWAAICKCSQDTATRDINNLVERGILSKGPSGGRSTNYLLVKRE
ncbi:MAG: Fic family protein [Veillonellales bacterium]